MQKYENWARSLYSSVAYVYKVVMWIVGFSVSFKCVLNEYTNKIVLIKEERVFLLKTYFSTKSYKTSMEKFTKKFDGW